MPVPKLTIGELPRGVHIVTLHEIEQTFGVQNERRKLLMSGLIEAAKMFKAAGVRFLLVDGSFTTDKKEPADIDGCWSATGDIDIDLIDPEFWDFDDVADFQKKRRSINQRYGLDFFIAEMIESESGEPFSKFFQTNKDGDAKGILKIILSEEDDL